MVQRMVNRGHPEAPILQLDFSNNSLPGFGFEALDLAELLRRGGLNHFARPRRARFFQLMLLSAGGAEQEIDFVPYAVRPGTIVFIRPGQVQRLCPLGACQGKVLLIEPSFLPAGDHSADCRSILPLVKSTPAIANTVRSLLRDYSNATGSGISRRVLFHEVTILLLRLQQESELAPPRVAHTPEMLVLFRRFEMVLDESFSRERSANVLASRLGCSEKTLNRACLAVAGHPPKAIIQQRVALEAKRILAHTNQPVKEIAAELGFSEATNFVKFFRRLVGVQPVAFRAQARSELRVVDRVHDGVSQSHSQRTSVRSESAE